MDVFDVEERKKELQKRRQRGSMFNGYSGNSTSGAPSVSSLVFFHKYLMIEIIILLISIEISYS